MTEINHYGKWIYSDKPITGVLSIHSADCSILSDECINGIDLDYQEALKDFNESYQSDHEQDFNQDDYDESLQYFNDGYESQDSNVLIGKWKTDSDGKYMPDKTGDYSAIVRESVIQIVYSKNTTHANLCSPCYPGQADLDSEGKYLAYTLPDDMLYNDVHCSQCNILVIQNVVCHETGCPNTAKGYYKGNKWINAESENDDSEDDTNADYHPGMRLE